jgi:23S rRNA (adenine2030-N6)-methyltransferase
MNYHHIFHAGNFADVLKHCVLLMLFEALCKKTKPILYLDTHAGIGRYDLNSPDAQKTCEFYGGIYKIYNVLDCAPVVKKYQAIVRSYNKEQVQVAQSFPVFYPGSPGIIHSVLRPQDTMILVDLHKDDAKLLYREFMHDKRVAVHNSDGYKSINAFLPPKQGRGLVLIDPAFEQEDELQRIIVAMQNAYERFPIGTYMLWFPIKTQTKINAFYDQLKVIPFDNILLVELVINQIIEDQGLSGCGLVIVNAPWQFDIQLKAVVNDLYNVLSQSKFGYYAVKWLVHQK